MLDIELSYNCSATRMFIDKAKHVNVMGQERVEGLWPRTILHDWLRDRLMRGSISDLLWGRAEQHSRDTYIVLRLVIRIERGNLMRRS